MWPDRVSHPGLLTYESGALPTALRGPAKKKEKGLCTYTVPCIRRDNRDILNKECCSFFFNHLPEMALMRGHIYIH